MINSGIFPCANYWLSCDYREYKSHTGIDIGYNSKQGIKIPIWAWRDGVVVHVGYDNSRGNYISLRHDYEDNTCQYTQYLHLDKPSELEEGDKVKQGDEIGIRGGTPKYGVHLHFCLTCDTENKNWTVKQIASHGIDSKKYLYKSQDKEYHLKYMYNPSDKTTYLGFKVDLSWLPDSPYPQPIERNEKVNQYEVINAIHWRRDPSIENAPYKFNVDRGIYNVEALIKEGNRTWIKVDDEHYFCGFYKDSTDGYGEYYEAESKDKERIKQLEAQVAELTLKNNELSEDLKKSNNKLNQIRKIVE